MLHPEIKMIYCPITGSQHVRLIEKISRRRISKLYNGIIELDTLSSFNGIDYILKYESIDTGYIFFYPLTLQGNESLYRNLEKYEWYYMKDKWEHHESLKFIQSDDKVLEIGCGEGAFLLMLKTLLAHDPIGIELNQGAVDKAKRNGLKAFNEPVENFALNNKNAFDVVCLFQVLEHIAEVKVFLNASLQTLKHGGKLIVCVPNNESFIRFDANNALNMPPHHMGQWDTTSLRNLADYFGLKLETIRYEPLQTYHIDWYLRTKLIHLTGEWIYNTFLRSMPFINLLRRYISNKRNKIKGHSILAIYIKK